MCLTKIEIIRQRLQNQGLSQIRFEKPEEVVDWLVAVQSQDYAGAKWALGARTSDATDSAIDQAFAEGKILRTHVMRPTWHFVTPADIRWLLKLTAPRVHAASAYMVRQQELDTATFERCYLVLEAALRGGQQFTRSELSEALQQAGIPSPTGLRLVYLLMQAELAGLICSGARRGKQFTYALLDERAAPARSLDRAEALVELARRYFLSRGPATVQDFAKWSGLVTADARDGLDAIKNSLEKAVLEGQTYWYGQPAAPVKSKSPRAYLLSVYDEVLSGYKDHSAMAESEALHQFRSLGNALSYIIVLDGQIVGTWRRELRKKTVVIENHLFHQLAEPESQAVAEAAQRYGEFLNLPVVWA